jgi:bacterioferritin (cytochrome b1)
MQQPTSPAGPQGNASALDPTTRRMLESILATEEEHADDLVGRMRGLHQ